MKRVRGEKDPVKSAADMADWADKLREDAEKPRRALDIF